MALDSAKVRVAVTGRVSVGDTDAVAPTDAVTALDASLVDLGYVSEDGITETRDRSTNKIKAWQNADVVREVVTEANLTYKLTLIETKKETVEKFYGSTVDADGKIVIVPANTGGRLSWVFDVIDGSDFIRIYVPQGEITEVGDQVYVNGDPIGYEITVTCYPDSTAGGSAVKWYSALDTTP